jgi:TonB family protein
MPRGFRLTLIGSAVLHVALAVGLVMATTGTSHSSARVETVITTKLVRLGKQRPKELLPRKPRPLPPPPKKSVAIEGATKPAVKKVSKRGASDRINQMSKLTSALDRLKKSSAEEEPEGHEDGAPEGEVSDLTQALIGSKYGTEIERCIHKHYAIEGIPPGRVAGKNATVYLRISPDGSFADFEIERGSGVPAADRAVERAIQRCGRVSAPPPEIRKQVLRDGIEVVFPMAP